MTCLKGMPKDECPYNPRLGCDCGAYPPIPPVSSHELEGKCNSLWQLSGRETEEWNGVGCDCDQLKDGNYNCKLNPF